MKLRRITEKGLMWLGINTFSQKKDDRRVLEHIILPAIAADPRFKRVLFIGCDYYTRPYAGLFREREFWTIEIDPRRARYGAARHVVGSVEELSHHFARGYFDAIICNGVIGFGLNTLDGAERAIAGCHDCLATNGILVLGWADVPKWSPFRVLECQGLGRFDAYVFPRLGVSSYLTATPYRHMYDFFVKRSLGAPEAAVPLAPAPECIPDRRSAATKGFPKSTGGVMAVAMKARQYAREIASYGRVSHGIGDFCRVMQVRLSLSKVGRVVCPRRKAVKLNAKGFGPGLILRSHTTDISVFNELAVWQGYASVTRSVSVTPRLIVDLGANTGVVARWLRDKYPDAFIVAVEPEAGNAAVLRENLKATGRPFRVVEACVGGHERRVELILEGGEFAFHMGGDSVAEGGGVSVVTMNTVLEGLGDAQIDLLKCDIEGAEVELFANSAPWIRRVQMLVAELHGLYDADRLMDAIRENGGRMRLLERVVSQDWRSETVILERL